MLNYLSLVGLLEEIYIVYDELNDDGELVELKVERFIYTCLRIEG
jgi:hypothetical protein